MTTPPNTAVIVGAGIASLATAQRLSHHGWRIHVLERAPGGDRWGDPRARLLSGPAWHHTRERVLTALELAEEPAGHLAELSLALEADYTRVLDGLGPNTAIQFTGTRLRLQPLEAAGEPPLMGEFRALVDAMMPRLDLAELLMEVNAFTHYSGPGAGMENFSTSVCALLIASADGMRFVVPSQNLHARSNPKYFGLRKRGATWLNVVNDQVMGLGGLVMPGTGSANWNPAPTGPEGSEPRRCRSARSGRF